MARPIEPRVPTKKQVMVCQNRRALHLYAIEERLEAGLVLTGSEVKSLRAGKAHLSDAYVRVVGHEALLVGGHIAEYAFARHFGHAPTRTRKLLLRRREIAKLAQKTSDKGYTAVALALYFTERGYAKVLVGLGRGKKEHDKRETLRAREMDREVTRALRRRNR